MWVEKQFPYFCWMILCGVCIMFLYDFLRISRRLIKQPDFIVNITDVLYGCICAIGVFYVTYLKNNGELRIHTAIGLMTGGALYFIIVRNRFVVIGESIIIFIFKLLRNIVRFVLYPIVFIIKIIVKPARIVIWYTGKGCKSFKHKTELKIKNFKHIMKHK